MQWGLLIHNLYRAVESSSCSSNSNLWTVDPFDCCHKLRFLGAVSANETDWRTDHTETKVHIIYHIQMLCNVSCTMDTYACICDSVARKLSPTGGWVFFGSLGTKKKHPTFATTEPFRYTQLISLHPYPYPPSPLYNKRRNHSRRCGWNTFFFSAQTKKKNPLYLLLR